MSGATTSERCRRKPAKDESIEMLLALSRSEVILEQMHLGLEQTVHGSVNQMLGEQALPPQRQRAVGPVPAKVIAALRDECNWNLLRPQIVALYKETFDQREIEALIQFYRSVAGRAILNTMPALVQGSMALAQAQANFLLPKMEQAVDKAVREAKRAQADPVSPRISVRRKAQR